MRKSFCMLFILMGITDDVTAQDTELIDVAAGSRVGDTIRGPITVQLRNINRLRYRVRVTRTSETVPADLSMRLNRRNGQAVIPAFSDATLGDGGYTPSMAGNLLLASLSADAVEAASGAENLAVNAIEGEDSVNIERTMSLPDHFWMVIDAVYDANRQWNALQRRMNAIMDTTSATMDSLNTVVLSSNEVLATSGASELVRKIRSLDGRVSQTMSLSWPEEETGRVLESIAGAVRAMSDLEENEKFAEWLEENENTRMHSDLASLVSDIIQASNRLYTEQRPPRALVEMRGRLKQWEPLLLELQRGEGGFAHDEAVGCGSSIGGTRYETIRLSRSDRWQSVVDENDGSNQAEVAETIVTVECPSRFTVSIGGVLSFVDTNEYDILPAEEEDIGQEGEAVTSTVNRVVRTRQSGVKQSAVVVVTGRIYSLWMLQFHLAVGTVVSHGTGDDDAGDVVRLLGRSVGSEYMVGGSISVGDVLFVSPMWHFAEVGKLEGDSPLWKRVPAGVTKVPVVRSIDPSFGLAVTLRLR